MKIEDLLQIEEKLITEQLSLERGIKVKNYLFQLDEIINKTLTTQKEQIKTTIMSAESLSKKFSLPLKVKGVFLKEGRPRDKFYSSEELKKAVETNEMFPIMQDHNDNQTSSIVGKVDKIEYDDNIKGIRWYGHVNDETVARNIIDGIIKHVSVTVYSTKEWDKDYGIVGTNLEFTELSTVIKGAAEGNSIEVVN